MQDHLGQEVVVGDKIAFNLPYIKQIIVGEVCRIGPRTVDATYLDWRSDSDIRRNLGKGSFLVVTKQFIVENAA